MNLSQIVELALMVQLPAGNLSFANLRFFNGSVIVV